MTFKLTRQERISLRGVVEIIEHRNFPRSIPEIGFRQICKRNHTVYKSQKLGLVIKQFHLIVAPNTPLKVRIPTANLQDFWVVQPLAIRKNAKEACEQIRKSLGGFNTDLHPGNVGWISDEVTGELVPKLFDW
jgi:hypothetical protein